MKRNWLVVSLSALLLLGAACGGDDGGDTDAGGDTEETTDTPTEETSDALAITGVDFAFELSSTTVPAGETTITFENAGEEPHELFMVPLDENAPPINELIELGEKEAQKYMTGEPITTDGPIDPGASTELTAELQPGNYGLVCFVESKAEKKPHAFLGMVNSLTVE